MPSVGGIVYGAARAGIDIAVDGVKQTYHGITAVTEALGGVWDKYEQQVAQLARNAGVSAAQFENMTRDLNKMTLALDENGKTIAGKYGATGKELAEWTNTLATQIGRNVAWTQDQYESYAAIAQYAGDTGKEIANAFQNFGVDAVQTGDRLSSALNKSARTGVNFNKVLENMKGSMHELQSLTFKNGIDGFTEMARQAASMNFSMKETLGLAQKIQEGDFNNLAEMSSQLQVLGGSFAQLSNPLEMLYEGTSDVGALQDRIIKMFSNMGRFNERTNQVELGRFEKMQAQQAAKALGINADEVFKMINTSAIKERVGQQIRGNFSEEEREFITNTATLNKEGTAVVRIGTEEKNVDQLTKEDIARMQVMKNADRNMTIAQIAQDVRAIAEIEEAAESQREATDIEMFQTDALQGLGAALDTLGTLAKSANGLVGGFLENALDNTIDWARNAIHSGNWSGEEINYRVGNNAIDIGKDLQAKALNASERDRGEMMSLAKTFEELGYSILKGDPSLKTIRKATAQARTNPVVSRLEEIIKLVKEFKDGFTNKQKSDKDKLWELLKDNPEIQNALSNSAGGHVGVNPHARGGYILDGVKNGGLLSDYFPSSVPSHQETPVMQHSYGGNMVTETAMPSEYIIQESATNHYGSLLDKINNQEADIIPHSNGGYAGNIEVKEHENGGNISVAPTITETRNTDYSYENIEHKHGGLIELAFKNGGEMNRGMLKEIMDGINSLLMRSDNKNAAFAQQ